MLKQPIITIVGAAIGSISRIDYDLANGLMDVQWRVTGITARYGVAYQTFRAVLQSPNALAEIQGLRASLRMQSVANGQRLCESGRRVIDIAAVDLPVDGQDLIAVPFKQALAKAAEGRTFLFG